jgi:hypothetical protein
MRISKNAVRRSTAVKPNALVLALMLAGGLGTSNAQTQAPNGGGLPLQPLPPAPAATIQAQVANPVPALPPPVASVRVPEGTEIHVHLREPLSSASANAGDTFSIVSDEEIRLKDGTVIPAGYSGKGEVLQAEKSGMLGKPGQLSIRLDYLKIGDVHVHLRANKTNEGKSNVTTMVVTTVLLTGFGLFIHGHSMVFPKGQPITAYVDDDAVLTLPIAPPPQSY